MNGEAPGWQTIRLDVLPEILVLHLMRFDNRLGKLDHKVRDVHLVATQHLKCAVNTQAEEQLISGRDRAP